jgi:RNA polymerase sigma factor (sigma-70 family)
VKALPEIIIDAKSGNEKSTEELIYYYLPLIKSIVNKFSRNLSSTHEKADLLQDAKVLFLELLNNYNPELSNFGYYLKITFEKAFYQKYYKFYFENELSYGSSIPLALTDHEDVFDRIDLLNDIIIGVESLSPKQKLSIKLYYFMDLPQEECAEYMAMKQSAFSRLLTRSRKKLKEILTQ